MLLAVCLGIDALVLWLLLGTDLVLAKPNVYAKSVEEALAERALSGPARTIRVSGVLVSGSLTTTTSCQTRFRLRPERQTPGAAGAPQPELVVVYASCRLPDTFCDLPDFELNVHVTGRLTGTAASSVLEAASVLATCPAKYSVDRRACETAPEAVRCRCAMCC